MQTTSSSSQLYHELSDLQILNAFNSDVEKGLTAEEVARRLEQYCFNELEIKQGKPAWLRLLLQFNQMSVRIP